SNGTSVYLGTWHSHPQNIPTPSNIDYADWKSCILRNPDRQLFFAIVGIQAIRIFFYSSLQGWNQAEINNQQVR
ncbi:Mov34/MPN/PAD-1 family protein, partial [Acinetobacter baumannii]